MSKFVRAGMAQERASEQTAEPSRAARERNSRRTAKPVGSAPRSGEKSGLPGVSVEDRLRDLNERFDGVEDPVLLEIRALAERCLVRRLAERPENLGDINAS